MSQDLPLTVHADFVDHDPRGVSADPLAMIVDPEPALDAARRMQASCRSGLRFFSDFRRVRSLDQLELADEEAEGELVDDGFTPFDSSFDPSFARRL